MQAHAYSVAGGLSKDGGRLRCVLRPAPLIFLTRLQPAGQYTLLLLGLGLYGLSLRLMLNAGVGVAPWDVFHVGVTHWLPLTVGQVSIASGMLLVLYTSLSLRERFGPGTLLNVVLIGLVMDLLGGVVPQPQQPLAQWTQFLLGVLLIGLATGAYVGAGLGAGPRDSLMLGLHRQRGWSVAHIRTGVELVVLAAGVLLGGPLGWGTLVYALGIGPSVSFGLGLFGLKGKKKAPSQSEEALKLS
ncbi:membrane protein [Deinococcus malanensis]|uniref:Membrane protein n=1 Tax=Deinococcus malanensis TaxID=1706855 RepID=A0ABQ2ETT1_9DEIO|nr:membrane protein [Deinococcus malanensis]